MLPPRKVQFEAIKRENENLRFRTFLKCNADADHRHKIYRLKTWHKKIQELIR